MKKYLPITLISLFFLTLFPVAELSGYSFKVYTVSPYPAVSDAIANYIKATNTFLITAVVKDISGVYAARATVKDSSGKIKFQDLLMYDDGAHFDGAAYDDKYGIQPISGGSWAPDTYTVYFSAVDNLGNSGVSGVSSVTFNVTKDATALDFSVSPQSAERGESVALSATLSSGGSAIANQTIAFYDGTAQISSGATNSDGVASAAYNISAAAPAGQHILKAIFAGTDYYEAASSTQTMNVLKPTISSAFSSYTAHPFYSLAAVPGGQVYLGAKLVSAETSEDLSGKTISFVKVSTGSVLGSSVTGSPWSPGQTEILYNVPDNIPPGMNNNFFKASFDGDSEYGKSSSAGELKAAHAVLLDFPPAPAVFRGISFNGFPIAYPNDSILVPGFLKMSADNVQPPNIGLPNQSLMFSIQSQPAANIYKTTNASGNTSFSFTAPAIFQNTSATGVTANECDYWVWGNYMGGSNSGFTDFYAPDVQKFRFISLGMPTKIVSLGVYNSQGSPITSIKRGTLVFIRATLKDEANSALLGKTVIFASVNNSVNLGTGVTGALGTAVYPWMTPLTPGNYTLRAKFYSGGNYCGSSTNISPSAQDIQFKVCPSANNC